MYTPTNPHPTTHHPNMQHATPPLQVDDCSKSAAKLALHLLKQPAPAASGHASSAAGGRGDDAAAAGDGGDDVEGGEVALSPGSAAALERLELLVALLEQYGHPSNTGGWSGDLAIFLRQVGQVAGWAVA